MLPVCNNETVSICRVTGEKNNFVRAESVELLKSESHRIDTSREHIGRHYASCFLIDTQQSLQHTALSHLPAGCLLAKLHLSIVDVFNGYSERGGKQKIEGRKWESCEQVVRTDAEQGIR